MRPELVAFLEALQNQNTNTSKNASLTILGFLITIRPVIVFRQAIRRKKMRKSVFYHAGCPVCVSAEHDIINLVGADNVEIVHLSKDMSRFDEAEKAGVKSVPALVTPSGTVLHINFGASMADVKG